VTDRSDTLAGAGLLADIARILSAQAPRTPAVSRDLLAAAEAHGVLPLVCEGLRDPKDVPAEVLARVRRDAAADVVREAELVRVVDAFAAHGVAVLIFKGAQLAYLCYPRPDLRPRLDTDLLVRPGDRERAHAVLTDLGYERSEQFTGDLVAYQATYAVRRDGEVTHVVDLHWRLANPQRFGRMLTTEEAFASAAPLARLSALARGLAPAHAMLVACVHPAAHHAGAARMIWAFDVHALSRLLTADDWETFAALASERAVAAECRVSLRRARAWYGTEWPRAIDALFDRSTPDAEAPRRHVAVVWSDLRHLGSWRQRVQLIGQHLFPPQRYMRQVYAPASGAPLPVLYVRRMIRGARKWFSRS
jgi:hypothetical protein